MSSGYSLRINNFQLFAFNGPPDESFLALFCEEHRRVKTEASGQAGGESCVLYSYQASVKAVRERLAVMGFTETATLRDFQTGQRSAIEEQEDYVSYLNDEGTTTRDLLLEKAKEDLDAVKVLDFATWGRNIEIFKSDNSPPGNYSQHRSRLTAAQLQMISGDDFWGFKCSDIRFVIRAFLATCADSDEVVLDYSELVDAGEIAADDTLVHNAQDPGQKIIVVTEGPSDTELIKKTMEVFYSHLMDLYAFVDRTTFAIEGGASAVFGLVKALASCGVSNRVIALFDNDTAGFAFLQKTKQLKLPTHFIALALPRLEFAAEYPTIGPHGSVLADINSCACSLEMYLGPTALRVEDGSFMPIQWTGFDKGLRRYQGELLDKKAVQQNYFRILEKAREVKEEEFAPMKAVLNAVFTAFHRKEEMPPITAS